MVKVYISACFLALFLLMFVVIPFRRIAINKISGKLLMPLTGQGLLKPVLVFVLAVFLIVFTAFREFKPLFQVILCACGLLGEYIMMTYLVCFRKTGVYENGILQNSGFILFESITSFPVLQLPEEERKNYDGSTLIFTTEKKGKVMLMFTDEAECTAAIEKMFEANPELRKLLP